MVGKALVCKVLRKAGLRWGGPAKKEAKLKPLNQEKEDLLIKMMNVVLDSLLFDKVHVVFIDEMKFPLHQTPLKTWRKPGSYLASRQVDNLTLTCIAACDQYGFLAL